MGLPGAITVNRNRFRGSPRAVGACCLCCLELVCPVWSGSCDVRMACGEGSCVVGVCRVRDRELEIT